MFAIEESLANEIVNYLAGRPYIEVVKYIDGLRLLKRIGKSAEPMVSSSSSEIAP